MYSFARENESFEYFLVASAILGGIGNGGSDGGDNGNGGSCNGNGTSSVGTIQENQVNELKCKITYISIYLYVQRATVNINVPLSKRNVSTATSSVK